MAPSSQVSEHSLTSVGGCDCPHKAHGREHPAYCASIQYCTNIHHCMELARGWLWVVVGGGFQVSGHQHKNMQRRCDGAICGWLWAVVAPLSSRTGSRVLHSKCSTFMVFKLFKTTTHNHPQSASSLAPYGRARGQSATRAATHNHPQQPTFCYKLLQIILQGARPGAKESFTIKPSTTHRSTV